MRYFKLQNIANGSDEAIKMFENTPIHRLLLERREFARLSMKKIVAGNDYGMLEIYNDNLKEFFNI